LIEDSLYVVDERAIAEAILARQRVHATVAAPQFRSSERALEARWFRRGRSARGFRFAGPTGLARPRQ
jgi:hypothetical protein